MSTGIESWNVDWLTLGPLYPFPGSELVWVGLATAGWILWLWHSTGDGDRLDRNTEDER